MLYVPDSVDSIADPGTDSTSSITPTQHVYYTDNTPKRQSLESETSFDSGYFSPPATGPSSFPHLMQQQQQQQPPPPLYTSSLVQQSPSKIAMMASVIDDLTSPRPTNHDLPLLDDWDKNFIENFEENLFSLDNEVDIGLLEGLFKSPLKSPLRILSPGKRGLTSSTSPYKMAVSRSPYKSHFIPSPRKMSDVPRKRVVSVESNGHGYDPTRRQFDGVSFVQSGLHGGQHQVMSKVMPAETMTTNVLGAGVLSASENKPSNTYVGIPLTNIGGPTAQKRIRLDSKSCTNPKQIRKTKENSAPCMSRQKLQLARANFRLSLEKAMETAASRGLHRKSDQYPQLSKALSMPSSDTAPSPPLGVSSDGVGTSSPTPGVPSTAQGNPYLEEDAEIPSSWLGGSCTEVGAYEVEPQSECKVVIRKRRR
ncbi:uncharacterized protein LOC124144224 [Haliotis rufescens]|uniref:uncharacterized protein LOC124144224 n=1 Tax=Haliotis rufescens TaxID=6454 RepID=UPI00201F254D|nr:uncharacterized protein LOC124144224 [Haliotis rufescens]